MSQCTKIRRKHRKVCDGAMQTLIEIYDRSVSTPIDGEVDYGEDFISVASVQAVVESTRGVVVFDQTNTERAASHTLYIRYIDFLTAENWIIIPDGDVVLDILNVEDFEYRHEYQKLICAERGPQSVASNLA